jgi:hypothetical protein
MARGWRKLLNEEPIIWNYSSPNVTRIVKPKMGWAGHVARIGDEKYITVFVGKLQGK